MSDIDLDDLKVEIRSVLIPARNGLTIMQFMSDFKELTNKIVPYKSFGYDTIESFVADIPDVVRLEYSRGDLVLFAVYDSESSHIARMVQNQKSSSSRPSGKGGRGGYRGRGGVSYQSRGGFRGGGKGGYRGSGYDSPSSGGGKYDSRANSGYGYTSYYNKPAVNSSSPSTSVPPLIATLPAAYRMMLKDLVSKFEDGLSASELLNAFANSYNKPLDLRKFGFRDVRDLLASADLRDLIIVEEDVDDVYVYPIKRNSKSSNYQESSYDQNLQSRVRKNSDQNTVVDDVLKVLHAHPQGLPCSMLMATFEKMCNYKLPLQQLGHNSVIEFARAQEGIRADRISQSDWILYAADIAPVAVQTDGNQRFSRRGAANGVSPSVRGGDGDHLENYLHEMLQSADGLTVDDIQSRFRIKTGFDLQQIAFNKGHDSIATYLQTEFGRLLTITYGGTGKEYISVVNSSNHMRSSPSGVRISPNSSSSIPSDASILGHQFGTQQVPEEELGRYISVQVLHAESPSRLWIGLLGRSTSGALDKLLERMKVFYKSERAAAYVMKEEFMSTGQVGAAVLHPTNLWHRVIIRSLPRDGFVEVFFLDHGDTSNISVAEVHFLRECFTRLPAQALECCLANISPMQQQWSSAATACMLKLVRDRRLMGMMAYTSPTKSELTVVLCDTNGAEDIHINDVMVAQGFAYNTNSLQNNGIPHDFEDVEEYEAEAGVKVGTESSPRQVVAAMVRASQRHASGSVASSSSNVALASPSLGRDGAAGEPVQSVEELRQTRETLQEMRKNIISAMTSDSESAPSHTSTLTNIEKHLKDIDLKLSQNPTSLPSAGRGRASILNLMPASSASRPGGSVVPSSSMATVLSAYDSLLSIPSQSVYGQGQGQNGLFAGLSTGSSLPSSLPAANPMASSGASSSQQTDEEKLMALLGIGSSAPASVASSIAPMQSSLLQQPLSALTMSPNTYGAIPGMLSADQQLLQQLLLQSQQQQQQQQSTASLAAQLSALRLSSTPAVQPLSLTPNLLSLQQPAAFSSSQTTSDLAASTLLLQFLMGQK